MGSSSSAATANIRRFCALARNAPGGAIGFEAVQGGEDTQATAPGFPEINLRFFGSHHNSSGCRTGPRGNRPADPDLPALGNSNSAQPLGELVGDRRRALADAEASMRPNRSYRQVKTIPQRAVLLGWLALRGVPA